MNVSLYVQLIFVAVLIVINAFFAASEIAIVSVRRTRLRQLAEEGKHPSAWAVLRLADNPSRFLATIQVGITLAGFFASAIGAVSAVGLLQGVLSEIPLPLVAEASGPLALGLVTVVVAFVTLIFGELVPKNLAVAYAESISLVVARPIEWTATVFAPVIALLTFTTNLILHLLGSKERAQMPEVTQDEIRSLIEAGEEEGVVEPIERRMIQGVFDFGETVVREVMVPRVDIVALRSDTTVQEALDVVLKAGYSRVPIYEGSLDNVIGILYAKDLLKHFGGALTVRNISEVARPAFFVPETKKVSELFAELQHSHMHIAIAVDEYETVERRLEIVDPSEVLASGKATLDELNEALGLRLEGHGEYDSVGGLIYSVLGRIPNPGDQVVFDDLTFIVLSVWGRRIRQVRVVRNEAA